MIIVCGGSGSRMSANINKQFLEIKGKEIIAHTIDKFYNNEDIHEIILVIKKEEQNYFDENIISKYGYKNIKFAFGGKERQDSVYSGIKSLDEKSEIVLVHDGARPFVSKDIIKNSIEYTKEKDAVIVCVKVKDTIKIIADNKVSTTPKRDNLISVQTPQVFKKEILKNSYEKAFDEGFYGTDDSSLVERIGQEVFIIDGSYKNIKITTPEDLIIGENLIK
ncbi:MAG: 2-C-methyl-D-erythritol 4-phosphate cytidylyltransferase [Peptostreptococcaceae bacterium]